MENINSSCQNLESKLTKTHSFLKDAILIDSHAHLEEIRYSLGIQFLQIKNVKMTMTSSS